MENKKYHTVGRVSKSNSKISERGKLHISFSTCYINVPGCMFKKIIICTDHRIIEILGFRPSNRLPVSYYSENVLTKLTDDETKLQWV
jgi:hypothetical protein